MGGALTKKQAGKILADLTGVPPIDSEITSFHNVLQEHDFDDPTAKHDYQKGYGRFFLRGEFIIPQREVSKAVRLDNGVIKEAELIHIKPWRTALEDNGFKVKIASYRPEEISDDEVHIRIIEDGKYKTDYGNPGSALTINFSVLLTKDKKTEMRMRIYSPYRGSKSINHVVEKIKKSKSFTHNTDNDLNQRSHDLAEQLIKEMEEEASTSIPYTILVPSWNHVIVDCKGLNNVLEETRNIYHLEINTCLDTGTSIKKDDREEFRKFFMRHLKLKNIKETRGLIVSSLAQKLLEERPFSNKKWHKTIKNGLTIRTRYITRAGSLGGEVIIEKDNRRILRLMNSKYEIPGVSIPESHISSHIEKPLSDFIDAPYVTSDMIVTSMQSQKNRIVGNYKDQGKKINETT